MIPLFHEQVYRFARPEVEGLAVGFWLADGASTRTWRSAVTMIGTKLADRYEILAELGRGGMGVVYRAKDPVLNREVAIKLIPPGNLTKDAEERFLREAQIVAQMDHPGIVPIHDLGRDEGALFFVMPVLPGTNLRSLLREGSLRLGDVLDIGTQVAEALDYSHARGIVHRDIKPENIMTSRDDAGHVRARVMDFGLALASTEDRLTKTGTLVGTVAYFSPEQVTSRNFDGRTDLYALGTVLYECLAGRAALFGRGAVGPLPHRPRAAAVDADPRRRRERGARGDHPPVPGEGPREAAEAGRAPGRGAAAVQGEAPRGRVHALGDADGQPDGDAATGGGVAFHRARKGDRRAAAKASCSRRRRMPVRRRGGRAGDRQEPAHRAAHEPRARTEDPRPPGPLRGAGPRLRSPGLLRADPGLLPRRRMPARAPRRAPTSPTSPATSSRSSPCSREIGELRSAAADSGPYARRKPRTRQPSSS